jgi:hypothetical protein
LKVRDKKLGREVDVLCEDCPKYLCYWPDRRPGGWACRTREGGCPDKKIVRTREDEKYDKKK